MRSRPIVSDIRFLPLPSDSPGRWINDRHRILSLLSLLSDEDLAYNNAPAFRTLFFCPTTEVLAVYQPPLHLDVQILFMSEDRLYVAAVDWRRGIMPGAKNISLEFGMLGGMAVTAAMPLVSVLERCYRQGEFEVKDLEEYEYATEPCPRRIYSGLLDWIASGNGAEF